MIHHTDVRIGNLVSINEQARKELFDNNEVYFKENIHRVTSVDIDEIRLFIDSMEIEFDYNQIEPIPLTEEWFTEKEFESNTKQWKGNGADYQPETSKTRQTIFEIGNEIKLIFEYFSYRNDLSSNWITDRCVKIEYCHDEIFLYKYELHVLQNLIHALIGKELTIQ